MRCVRHKPKKQTQAQQARQGSGNYEQNVKSDHFIGINLSKKNFSDFQPEKVNIGGYFLGAL